MARRSRDKANPQGGVRRNVDGPLLQRNVYRVSSSQNTRGRAAFNAYQAYGAKQVRDAVGRAPEQGRVLATINRFLNRNRPEPVAVRKVDPVRLPLPKISSPFTRAKTKVATPLGKKGVSARPLKLDKPVRSDTPRAIDKHSDAWKAVCKKRPEQSRGSGGKSKRFVPWC